MRISFSSSIGYTKEICDCVGFASGRRYTHTGTLKKYGIAVHDGHLLAVVYFDGDSDIEGWYPETMIDILANYNTDDTVKITGEVIVLKS